MLKKFIWLLAGLILILVVTLHASDTPVAGGTIGLNAQTASAGTHTPYGPGLMSRCRESALYIAWGTGVTSGVVTVESSYDPAYTGTWASLAVVTFAGTAPNQDIVQITGIHAALRARITTIVAGGGTVSSYLHCN